MEAQKFHLAQLRRPTPLLPRQSQFYRPFPRSIIPEYQLTDQLPILYSYCFFVFFVRNEPMREYQEQQLGVPCNRPASFIL